MVKRPLNFYFLRCMFARSLSFDQSIAVIKHTNRTSWSATNNLPMLCFQCCCFLLLGVVFLFFLDRLQFAEQIIYWVTVQRSYYALLLQNNDKQTVQLHAPMINGSVAFCDSFQMCVCVCCVLMCSRRILWIKMTSKPKL